MGTSADIRKDSTHTVSNGNLSNMDKSCNQSTCSSIRCLNEKCPNAECQSVMEGKENRKHSQGHKNNPWIHRYPRGLDGGWGWNVLIGATVIHAWVGGHNFSFTLFYMEMLRRFEQSAAKTSFVMALFGAVKLFSSKYSYRAIRKIYNYGEGG